MGSKRSVSKRKRSEDGQFTLEGCESIEDEVKIILPPPWSDKEHKVLRKLSATTFPYLRELALSAAQKALRARLASDSCRAAMITFADPLMSSSSSAQSAQIRQRVVNDILVQLRRAVPADKEVRQPSKELTDVIRMRITPSEIEALNLKFNAIAPSSKLPNNNSRVRSIKIMERIFDRSCDLNDLLGPSWYMDYSGRVIILFCPPIRFSVCRIITESRKRSFFASSFSYSPMEVLATNESLEMEIRLRYACLFHDIPGCDMNSDIDLYTNSSHEDA